MSTDSTAILMTTSLSPVIRVELGLAHTSSLLRERSVLAVPARALLSLDLTTPLEWLELALPAAGHWRGNG